MPPHRIYADFHGQQTSPRNPNRSAVPLDTFGSLRDLSNAGLRLRDGLAIAIYMDSDEHEDIQADTHVFFDPATRLWFAELDTPDIRDVPCSHPRTPNYFLCLTCRTPLPASHYGRPTVDTCPTCHTPITAAIAPPEETDPPTPT